MSLNPLIVISAIGFSVFAGVVSTSMLTIAYGDIVRSFGIDYSLLQWRSVCFFSFFAVSLAFFGRTAERVGYRRQIIAGQCLFVASAALSSLPQHWFAFLCFQTLQGIADAMIVPAQMGLIRKTFPEDRMGWALARFEAVLTVATLCGPALGGLILEYGHWRYLLGCLSVVASVALLVTLTLIPPDMPSHSEAKRERLPIVSTLSLLVTMLVAQLLVSPDFVPGYRTLVAGLGVVAIGVLIWSERKCDHASPLFAPTLIRNRAFGLLVLRAFLFFLAGGAVMHFGASYLRDVHGLSPQRVGWIIIADSVLALLAAGWAGKAADKAPRAAVIVGACVSTAGLGLLGSATPPAWVGMLIGAYLCLGVGGTFNATAQNTMAILSVPQRDASSAMGLFHMVQFVSGGFAGALFGPLVETELTAQVSLAGFRTALVVAFILLVLGMATLMLDRGFCRNFPAQPLSGIRSLRGVRRVQWRARRWWTSRECTVEASASVQKPPG